MAISLRWQRIGDKHYAYIVDTKTTDGKKSRKILQKLGLVGKDISKSQARVKLDQYLARKQPDKGDITFGLLLDEFVPYYEAQVGRTIRPRTLDMFNYNMSKFKTFFRPYLVKDINFPVIERFKSTLDAQIGNRTTNLILTDFTKVLRFGIKSGYLDSLPVIEKLKVVRKAIQRLSIEDVELLLENTKGGTHFAIKFMVQTGLRPFEFLNLEWRDIDFKQSVLFIRSDNKKKWSRFVPISEELLLTLKILEPDKLSREKVCGYSSRHGLRTAIRRASKRILGYSVPPYVLRKTFASIMSEQGIHPYSLKDIMGHSEATNSEYYVKLNAQKLGDDLNKYMPSFEKG